MNKHLLLALLFLPLTYGCESTSGATSTDVAAVIPGIQWEVHHFECKTDANWENQEVILSGIDWAPVSIAGAALSKDGYYTPILPYLYPDGTVTGGGSCDPGKKGTVVLGY